MAKPLLSLKKLILFSHFALKAMGLIILVSLSFKSSAQIYFVTNDESPLVTSTTDALKRVNYNGTGVSTMASNFTTSPSLLELDLVNNRAFVIENYYLEDNSIPFNVSIKVLNLNTGALINSIPVPFTARIGALKYDAANDFIYYVTQDVKSADASNATSNDALIRVKPNGTGSTTLATGVTKHSTALALNIDGNEIYIMQNLFAEPRIVVVDLAGSFKRFLTIATDTSPYVRIDMAYDNVANYIYYLTGDNLGSNTTKDALWRIRPDGTEETVIKRNLGGYIKTALALDAGNNRAFFYDDLASQRGIYSVNLTNGTTALVYSSTTIITGMATASRAVVTSATATGISSTSATLGGSVTRSDLSVTERGIIYSTSNSAPTLTANDITKVANGTGTGAFSANIANLSPVTPYYARSYAITDAGTTYGAVVTLTTLSNDANLSAFTTSAGTLSPSFSATTTTYTASVDNNVTSITITPTKNQANASIKVNGTSVNSGTASGNISLNVGSNTITIIVTAQDNSTKTYTLTVTRAKAPQTITFNTLSTKIYGNSDFAPGATASSGLTLSYSSNNTGVATIINNQIHIVGQGTATITASQAGDAAYLAATSTTQTLTVNKASITVTAVAKTKVYGDADPSLTYTITSGSLVGNDTFTGSLSRIAGTDVGQYAINQSNLALSANYTLSYVSANLIITKRPIALRPAPATKVYGNAEPASYPYSFDNGTSLAIGDGMTGFFVRTAGENVGTYPLALGNKKPVNATTGADLSHNYEITFTSANLTITKRPLIFHPIAATKVYGDVDPNLPYSFDNGTSVAPNEGITGTFGRVTGEDIGTYAFTLGSKKPVNINTGVSTAENYDISFVSNNLTITKRAVKIYAQSQTKTYGDAEPTLTTFIQGSLKEGDALTGSMVRVAGENVGTYAITQGTLALSNNYDYTFTGENFIINKKTIYVIAGAKSKTYGDVEPSLSYTATTLPFGENFSGSITRASGENFGTYPITQGTLALTSNYILDFTSADFNISKRTINVTANVKSKTYGDPDPTFNYLSDALIGSDTFNGSLSRAPGENVGNHVIQQGTLSLSNNYTLDYTAANLSINKSTLTYVATPINRFLKTANPTFTGSVIGFAYGETIATATTGSLVFSTTALLNSPVGSYAINGSGLSAINYNFVQDPANNTALSITASGDNTLSALSSSIDLLPTFSPSELNYGAGVAHNVASFNVSAVVNSSFATATLNGLAFISGSTQTLPLNVGGNEFLIVVTAQDGTIKTYRLFINRAYSTNNLLTSLVIPGLTLTPTFDPAVTTYHATVPNTTENIDLYGIAVDSTAVVMGNNGLPNTAQNPLSLPVSVGEFNYSLPVIAQNGARKDYTIIINRLQSADATLASFGNGVVTFNTPIVAGTFTYSGTVTHPTASGSFNPVTTNSGATIQVLVNDQPVDNYGGYYMTFGFGTNNLKVIVTSQNGEATKTYNLNITREKSNDASLNTLFLPYLTNLNESFDENVFAYTANLADSTITGLPFTAYTKNEFATMRVNGTLVARFQNYFMSLHGGANTFDIVVTSQDETTIKTYKLVLTRAGQAPPLYSPIAKLTSLTVSSGTSFSKNFNFNFVDLETITAPNSVASVRFFLNKEHPNSTITLNGAPYKAEVNEADYHPIAVGDNLFTVVVTAEDGVVNRTYEIHVNRLPYVNVDLASLMVSNGTYTPSFSPEITTYNLTVRNSVTQLTITPVAAVNTATIGITGALDVTPQNPTAIINLNPAGPPQMIRMTVRAADGLTTKRYTLNVTRLAPSAKLANLTLSSGSFNTAFSPDSENLTATLPYNVSSITLIPTAEDTNAVIKVNETVVTSGNASSTITLSSSNTTINIQVTSAAGNTKTYSITINKLPPSNNAGLSNFTLSPAATLLFVASGPASVNYETSVSPNTSSVQLSSTSIDPNATIRVNGTIVASRIASGAIPLINSTTIINVLVTAEDGVTTKTYSISIFKQGSSITTLRNISLNLNEQLKLAVSGPASLNYTTSVAQSVNTVLLTPTATDPSATIQVNGKIVSSGFTSTPITLNAGTTVINILVTAEDGISTRTYSVSITKDGSSNANLNNLNLNPYSMLTLAANGPATINYNASVSASTASVTLAATAVDANAKIRINGTLVSNGTASAPINLITSSTVINVLVTAEDGITTKTYSITVNKAGSSNANLDLLRLSPAAALTLATTGPALINYAASVANNVATVTLTPRAIDPSATIKINGSIVISNTPSSMILIGAGTTVINILVTAEDGTTTKTYSITITKQGNIINQSISKNGELALAEIKPATLTPLEVSVHPALSPNGDGVNDVLKIDGIETYPNNKLTIMNRAGAIIFNKNGYNNSTRVFDGHANNGTMQLPGTYFYTFEYKDGQQTKRKTGYIIIKY